MNDKIYEKVMECGFDFCKKIKTSQMVFERSLRESCEMNRCGKFGGNYCCPPHIGQIDDCIAKVQSYEGGYIFQYVAQLEDSYDFEGMMAGQDVFTENVLKLNELLHGEYENFLLLGAGPCMICEECAIKRDEPCVHPDKKIASVEAHGVFVNATLVNVGLKYNNGENTVSYCGVVLFKEEK